jgi:hypothetical protein
MPLRAVACTVFVAKPPNITWSEATLLLIEWMGSRKIQSAGFKLRTEQHFGFDIKLSSERDAVEFQSFYWPPAFALAPHQLAVVSCQ